MIKAYDQKPCDEFDAHKIAEYNSDILMIEMCLILTGSS
jgi:hypothetical protein